MIPAKPEGDISAGGMREIDWETMGQRTVRHEVAMLAERWGWNRSAILELRVRERKAYCYRVIEYAERESKAYRK